jgi:hypothetical protein
MIGALKRSSRAGMVDELQGKGCGQQDRDQYTRHLKWLVQPPQAPPHIHPARRIGAYATHTLAFEIRRV